MSAFEYDIFISYAHIDNETISDAQKGWIDQFHRALKTRLAQLHGKRPEIWQDHNKLRGHHEFDEEIIQELFNAAVLVSVLSPPYLKSKWCIKEIDRFAQAAEEEIGLHVENKSRIFKVIKTDVPHEEHPPVVKGVLGYKFYETDPENRKRIREFSLGPGTEPEIEQKYITRLDDLAHDIIDLLESLKATAQITGQLSPPEEQESNEANPSSTNNSNGTVYLAETSYDRAEDRDQIKRTLQDRGYTVLPEQPLPQVGPELEQFVEDNLNRCDLAVHIIGQNYGIIPEAAEHSAIELQYRLSEKHSKTAGFSRIIWIPPDLTPGNDRQKEFVEFLQNNPAGAELLETPLENLKSNIEQKLASQTEEFNSVKTRDAEDALVIYLIFDKKDEDNIWDIHDHLADQGFAVDLYYYGENDIDVDEAIIRQEHEESLRECDAVLIYQGQANEAWLRSKIRGLRKIAGYGRTKPMLSKAIYIAAPETPRKARFRDPAADIVIKDFGDFSSELLEPFLARLGSDSNGGE